MLGVLVEVLMDDLLRRRLLETFPTAQATDIDTFLGCYRSRFLRLPCPPLRTDPAMYQQYSFGVFDLEGLMEELHLRDLWVELGRPR